MCFLRVTSVLWFLRDRRSGRARCVRKSRQNALVPDGCSCGTRNQAQRMIVALVNPVAQETRIAKQPSTQHKVDSQVDFGFPWAPRGFIGRARNRGTRRSSGRRLQSEDAVRGDLVMSKNSLGALPASSNGVGFDIRAFWFSIMSIAKNSNVPDSAAFALSSRLSLEPKVLTEKSGISLMGLVRAAFPFLYYWPSSYSSRKPLFASDSCTPVP